MGLNNIGAPELAVIIVLALFVFGPDRLPGMAAQAGRTLRQVRLYVKGMTDDLKNELGPELGDVDLASLNPRAFVQKHLFEDEKPVSASTMTTGTTYGMSSAGRPLGVDEPAPWDPDTT